MQVATTIIRSRPRKGGGGSSGRPGAASKNRSQRSGGDRGQSPLPRGTNDESLLVEGEVVSTLTLLHSYDSIQRSWLGEGLTVNLMDLYISF